MVIANEVLDNMPTRLVERTADGWMETRVGESSGSLTLVSVPADPELSAWCDTRLAPAPVGRLVAAQQQFDRWMEDLAVTLGPLAICVIDYGGSTLELGQRDRGSVVRSYLSQHSGLDYLVHPGETDVTVDVNTDVLAAAAHASGGDVTEVSQRSFLADLGVPGILADIRRRANEFASSGDVMAQVAARSEAVGIGALMDASGLGGFRVMLISRPSG